MCMKIDEEKTKAAKPNLTPVTLPEPTRQWESSAAPSTWLVLSECH